jgi:dienelactone hydrolase
MVDGFWGRPTDMTQQTMTASEGHQFSCWFAKAHGTRRGTVVVLQKIFGVNHHIQSVCGRLAEEGYDAYVPALFDRLIPNFSSGYSKEEIVDALTFLPRLNWDHMVHDVQITVNHTANLACSHSLKWFALHAPFHKSIKPIHLPPITPTKESS